MRAANKRDLMDFLEGKDIEIFHAICGGGYLTYDEAKRNNPNLKVRLICCTGCASNWSVAFIKNADAEELSVRFSVSKEPVEEVYKLVEMEDGPNIYTKLVKVT